MRALSRKNIICIRCPKGCRVSIEYTARNNNLEINNITGYGCPKGKDYAEKEFIDPTRILPTTVKVRNGELPLVPVKTKEGVPKDLILPIMSKIAEIEVEAPVKTGQVVKSDLMNKGVDLVATRNITKGDNKWSI